MKLNERRKSEIEASYDFNSLIYDEQRFLHPGGKYLDRTERYEILKHLNEGSVLELGTGTSRYGRFLSNKGFDFTGIDLSRGMLGIAKLNTSNSVNLIQGDAENLCIKPNSFNNMICVHALRFISPEIFFEEAYRVLKPGGIAIGQLDSLDNPFTKLSLRLKKLRGIEVRMNFYSLKDIEEFKCGKFTLSSLYDIKIVNMFNFPNSFYHCLSDFSVGIVKKIDNKFKNGNIILVIAKKR